MSQGIRHPEPLFQQTVTEKAIDKLVVVLQAVKTACSW